MSGTNIEYAFLSIMIPEEKKDEIFFNSKNNMQEAANVLQWHLYNGLSYNLNKRIKIFNILPIGSYPQYYKKIFIKKEIFDTKFDKNNINIGFCNIKGLRRFFQEKNIYYEIKKWCDNNDSKKILFVYTINPTFISVISKIKDNFENIKICAIVADLPNMVSLSKNRSIFRYIYEKKYVKKNISYLSLIDYYVLLTEHMANYLKIKQPYCIIEGISTQIDYSISNNSFTTTDKVILYAGTLHKRFGIMNLLYAFEKLNDQNIKLIICGTGDCENEIKQISKKNKNVLFLGQLSRDEVINLQKKSTALINPRQNQEEFTKYSFPSKNLEYLSTGVPLIAYKLDGIPNEYDEYINYVPDNSIDSLVYTIKKVCNDPDETIKEKAFLAREFVLNEKNEIKQTKKIIDMMEEKNEDCIKK